MKIDKPTILDPQLADPTDDTKIIDWDITGLTTATVRTVTMPDANVDLTKVGLTSLIVAASDETTDLATGTGVMTFIMPYAMTLTDVVASVGTAPTGSTIEVDINEAGVSILSTVISIDATEKNSTTAATPPVISDSSLAQYAEITIDIDQVGSGTAGAGLKIYLIGSRT